MVNDDKFALTLLVQNARTVFCYFNISPVIIKIFQDRYGEDFWKNSKQVLKVYDSTNNSLKELQTINLDPLANNWFINLDRSGIDVFVKLGRILPDGKFIPIFVSNTVTTPRDDQSNNSNVYYIDVSENFNLENNLSSEDNISNAENDKKESPYSFFDEKKN
ncbi:hypothetical protein CPAST_c16340 [Clostridium pasteurianum DSM 525 = ATCC 6013]|uniref:DUF4912 domain-containing protein n=1 Tax=Clostridium pasteurianum DSM 525 = ATCC 6013 TaxID=1262449 RepID=A0A0H3J2N1_CLOPA|nr:DUF4912 domain-containing protein [Clostridium pasteurianum]AJA47709.1 hypothetical protein CPAST_c16340 [Clostridium pasteurianum DSM 525 = ATCC 6013]AJA51697.1 hypothetical protein CLPA_c16340 [Clostridium pasteurianum DSM 525 = ATCC 6013]AOZ75010.1 hypothetical protein AQ983_07900 [Clostridium pasteurianum DSM 525 = ATCC 6013]AOZ78805.1 hypothetical protein AQ984_07890 [Clostridium pasteurianum]ELP59611.1 hypothetical protein F502_07093 [Clostridium pasteurianum DSM 525 = ATCC 6013]